MIRGKNVYLRSVEKRDINTFYDICSDKEIRKYDGGYMIFPSVEYMVQNFEEITSLKRKALSIINEKGVLIGYTTYYEYEDSVNVYAIGITIASRFWGRGYGKDTIEVLLDYLFMYKAAERVELEVVNYNNRAIKCYERCGFIKEGIKRKKYFSQGVYNDTIIMGILKEDYNKFLSSN